jgi:hypothetical protein
MSKKFGIIAEDKSDIEVISEILKKYIPDNKFKISKFVGNGCGKLRNKCGVWTDNLFKSGCDFVFVFHDKDKNCRDQLRKSLEIKVCPKKYKESLIIIPVEELEAWLLSDVTAIKNVFRLEKQPKKISDCESIESPKEHLRDLVWKLGKRRYLNTVHNKKIAQETSLENLKRCPSFNDFADYIEKHICA